MDRGAWLAIVHGITKSLTHNWSDLAWTQEIIYPDYWAFCVQSLRPVGLFATLWTVACQVPLSVEFSRQKYWSGLPFPPPGDLPDQGSNPCLVSTTLAGEFFRPSATWEVFWGGSDSKASACNAGDPGSTPGLGRSPGEGNGNPLQYSCLENSMDRGTWQVAVHVVTNRHNLETEQAHRVNIKSNLISTIQVSQIWTFCSICFKALFLFTFTGTVKASPWFHSPCYCPEVNMILSYHEGTFIRLLH